MMRFLLVVVCMALSSVGFAKTEKKKIIERKGAAAESYFNNSKKDIAEVLSNSIFERYMDHTVVSLRQGEIGEAQAYFVRLEKPFSSTGDGVCINFRGTKEIVGEPHACDKAE